MKQHTIILPQRTLTFTNPEEAVLALAELHFLQRRLLRTQGRILQYIDKRKAAL